MTMRCRGYSTMLQLDPSSPIIGFIQDVGYFHRDTGCPGDARKEAVYRGKKIFGLGGAKALYITKEGTIDRGR